MIHLPGRASQWVSRATRYLAERRLRATQKRFYAQFVQPNDLCFDVGANQGDKTRLLLDLGARVVAVEPQPAMVEQLRSRFAGNSKVTVIAKALAESPGTRQMAVCSEAPTISTMSSRWRTGRFADSHQWDRTIDVPVTTLDQLVDEFGIPRYCKIDVEGYELPVLRGLTRPVGVVSFEYTAEFLDDAKAICEYLASLGPTRLNFTTYEHLDLVMPRWDHADAVLEKLAALSRERADLWGDIYASWDDQTHDNNPAGQRNAS